jgi:hypothetical protein
MQISYTEIAKALIQDSKKQSETHFDFSNMDKLASQLEEMFVLRWGKKEQLTLKNVAEYVRSI